MIFNVFELFLFHQLLEHSSSGLMNYLTAIKTSTGFSFIERVSKSFIVGCLINFLFLPYDFLSHPYCYFTYLLLFYLLPPPYLGTPIKFSLSAQLYSATPLHLPPTFCYIYFCLPPSQGSSIFHFLPEITCTLLCSSLKLHTLCQSWPWSWFVLVSEVTTGYILTSPDVELGASKRRQHGTVKQALFSPHCDIYELAKDDHIVILVWNFF